MDSKEASIYHCTFPLLPASNVNGKHGRGTRVFLGLVYPLLSAVSASPGLDSTTLFLFEEHEVSEPIVHQSFSESISIYRLDHMSLV